MSDLIERLRHADSHSQQRPLGSRIFGEAADEIERLRAEIERFRSERAYVLGCNDGFETAISRAASLIEDYIIMDTCGGKVLAPRRQDGNRDGLHYADAIRNLATSNPKGCADAS